ncbi:MAG TPA: transcription elongation factor GreA [Dehalococcoidia bacterium]|jgi:transcription elongation factor GreA|nr:transcription elongation factor GreA [Dehalococcoidia bacterium]
MSDATLEEAATKYLETVKGAARQPALAELNRFQRWYGSDRLIGQIRGHDVALYGEAMGPATPETQKRAEQLRAFFVFLKKDGLLDQNLAPHLRLRKAGKSSGAVHHAAQPSEVELTQEGVEALKAELATLLETRIIVREEIRKAMLDKDFRENAPLDAAKDKQGHTEARIRDIEAMLKRAVIVDGAARTGRVRVGSTVRVKNASSGKVVEYSIVGPTEANAAEGKISSVSPVGKALLDCVPGDEVEVEVPSGTLKLQVEAVHG